MSEPVKKERTKKSRPKSEVVKSSSIEKREHKPKSKTDADAGETRTTKRSHSRKDKSSHVGKVDNSAELDALRKEIETLKSSHQSNINELNEQVAALKKQNEELASKAGKKSSSSSSSSSDDEAVANLTSQLNAEKSKLQEKETALSQLQKEIEELRSENENKEKALEAEFDKYKVLQGQVHTLSEKQAQLEKENQELRAKAFNSSSGQPSGNVLSPRGQAAQGNIPAWKQRELEKQKEAEELREREQRAKLQKVQSLRSTRHEVISNEPITQGFKDPVLNKPSFHHGGVIDKEEENEPVLADNQTEEEKIAAELARMNRTLKKGGHAI